MREDQGNFFFVLKTTSWKNEGLIFSWDNKEVDEQTNAPSQDGQTNGPSQDRQTNGSSQDGQNLYFQMKVCKWSSNFLLQNQRKWHKIKSSSLGYMYY